ncbi:MAG: hypothetical protein PVJ02_14575 [Gemmatimonadota bacterium]
MRSLIPMAAVFTLLAAVGCEQPLPTAATGKEQGAVRFDVQPFNRGEGVASSVTGSGHYTTAAGYLRIFTFEVREASDGTVHGTFQLTAQGSQSPARLHGTLSCLSVVGQEAWIGGVYEHASNPALVGRGFWFYVRDNGEGQGDAPDLVRRHVRSGNADDCALRMDPGTEYLFPIEAGNVQVHGQ